MPEDHNRNEKANSTDNPAATNECKPVAITNESGASCIKQDPMNNGPRWTDTVMAVFTVLIFLTYLTSDYVLWQQFNLTQQALKDSEESFKKTLRQMQAQTTAQQEQEEYGLRPIVDLSEGRIINVSKFTRSHFKTLRKTIMKQAI